MSAIFGVFALDGAAASVDALERMSAVLAPDGPDSEGRWTHGPVGLGCRLAYFTPQDEKERQPLLSGAGDLAIVCDGRIDNRSEMARLLGIRPSDARAMPDSAFLQHAYGKWAEGFLDHMVGDFTAAIWNGRTGQLVIACSAPLARPLHYWRDRDQLAFASRARGLLALPGIERRVDEYQVAAFITASVLDHQRSFFYGIRRLLPGQLLTVSRSGTHARQWWRPDLTRRLEHASDEECVEDFTSLLTGVVGDHLRGKGAVAMTLSGGLDSGGVAAIAAPLLGREERRLRGYTVVPPRGLEPVMLEGRYADESPRVRALAEIYPALAVTLVDSLGTGLMDGIDRWFEYAETPFRNAANRGWMEEIYASAQASGSQVLLNGDQGNLTVSWDGLGLLGELISNAHPRRAATEARALTQSGYSRSVWRVLVGQGLLPLLPLAPAVWVDRLRRALLRAHTLRSPPPLLNPAFAAEHGLPLTGVQKGQHPGWLVRNGGRDARLRVLVHTGVGQSDASAGFRAMYGVDTRAPLADRRLVEFCLALPETRFAAGGEQRLLIRRAMAGRLPPETLGSRARGLQAPAWFEAMSREREQLLAEVERLGASALTRRVLDVPRMRNILQRWPSRPPTNDNDYVSLRFTLPASLVAGRFLLWASRAG